MRFKVRKLLLAVLSMGAVALLVLRATLFQHPIFISTSALNLEAFIPYVDNSQISTDKPWFVAPVFYQLGALPKEFEREPVFYTIPYESGPPYRFVGKIILHLKDPDLQLVFEGPKTPAHLGPRNELKTCLTQNIRNYSCIRKRMALLSRHLEELHSLNPESWDLRWFQIRNPALNEEEQPQGVYLQARGSSWIQDRFILINPNGMNQTLILRRPLVGQESRQAFDLVTQTLGSFRSFDDLNSGRAWINRELQEIKLDEAQTVSQLAQVQGLLLSRISVDPTSFDSYYHLAGTSLLLAKKRPEFRIRGTPALDNLKAALRFAKDVAPLDPRIKQLEEMEAEAKKFFASY